jgi:hypothetical protein
MIWARSSWFSIMRLNHLRRIWARSLAGLAPQAFWALAAASMALRVSAWPRFGTEAITSSFTGLVTSIASLPETHLPSM